MTQSTARAPAGWQPPEMLPPIAATMPVIGATRQKNSARSFMSPVRKIGMPSALSRLTVAAAV